jgi:DNA-binding MarR family transcriptional regulator
MYMPQHLRSKVLRAAPLVRDPLESLLGYQLRRASLAMLEDLVDALKDLDFRPTSASVLLLATANPGITQSRIGRSLAIERANMAPITAKLIEQGMLSRTRADGRSQGLHATDEGKRVAAKIRKRIADHEEKFWNDTKPSERDAVMRFLKSLWIK